LSYAKLARDEDICPLRAPREIIDAVINTGIAENVPVVDFLLMVDRNATASVGYPVPGAESFLDHVHPRIETHRQLAVELLKTLRRRGHTSPKVSASEDEHIFERVSGRILGRIDETWRSSHNLAVCTKKMET
jgi:hypothetical protein